MPYQSDKSVRRRSKLLTCLLVPIISTASCTQLSYYHQAVAGHLEITRKQRPIVEVIEEPETDVTLRKRLQLVQKILAFAESEMQLPSGGNYTCYADVGREHIVWNVFATPEFSMKPQEWWYPVVGFLPYRGYYSKADADKLAGRLRKEGKDVHVGGVDAYSTLGIFRDPVLNTFVDEPEHELVAVLCHELAHRRLFISSDADFSEAFAVCVEREAQRRWFKDGAKLAKLRAVEDAFRALVFNTRDQLDALYKQSELRDESQLRTEKAKILTEMTRAYQQLVDSWGGKDYYKKFFNEPVNNSRFSSLATYYDLLPRFDELLAECNHELEIFYQRAETIGKSGEWKRTTLQGDE